MVAPCANPRCESRFRYLREGRLYAFPDNSAGRIFWLCPQCTAVFDIVLDEKLLNPVLVSRSSHPERDPVDIPVPIDRVGLTDFSTEEIASPEGAVQPMTLVEWTTSWLEDQERASQQQDLSGQAVAAPAYKGEVMEWAAGTICRRTGVHQVTHHQHRPAHKVIVQEGEKFPPCRKCGTLVSFQFLQPLESSEEVEHIGYDRDFMEWEWGLASGEAS